MAISNIRDFSSRPLWFRYGLMTALVMGAVLINLVVQPWLVGRESLLPFMVAVLMSAMLVGTRPGFVAMVLSIAAGLWFLDDSATVLVNDYLVRVTHFIILSFAMLCLVHHTRRYQQREAETLHELEQREEQLRTVIEKIPIGVWLTDSAGMTLAVNEAGRNIWGGARYVGMTEYPRYYPMKNVETGEYLKFEDYPVVRAVRDGAPVHDEVVEIEAFNGESRMMRISAVPLRLRCGTVFGTVVLCENVTEQRRNMEELQRAKEQAESASLAKDRFLAILSHELRTPLTPVLMLAEQLENHPNIPETLRADAALIRRHITLEARLIDDLLDLTRIERGRLQLDRQQIDAHQALSQAIALIRPEAERKQLKLALHFESPRHFVYADSARLKQVFLNIIGNALKFTPAGGTITVRTDTTDHAIRIRIADTGIGVDDAVMENVFGEFEQGNSARRFGGLGLGLPIARALVELHDGSISLESGGPGKGTEVTLLLPASLAASSPASMEKPLRQPSSDGAAHWRILLVEDHEPTAFVLARLLRRRGHEVEVAASVKEAIAGSQAPFDYLVSDIGLPDGTGLDIISHYRRHRGDTFRAIALSGFGMEADVARSLAAGFDRHLVKPVDFHTLQSAIVELAEPPPERRKTA